MEEALREEGQEERGTSLPASYVQQIAKIHRARLGWEDHGIFTVWLDLDYGGSGQGAGGYSLDAPERNGAGNFIRKRGTAYGLDWIMRVMEACGVKDWSQIEGRTVLALREEGWNGRVVGIKPLPTEKGKPFVFDELRWDE